MFKVGLVFQKYSQDYLNKLNVKNFNNEYFNIEVTVENKSIDQFIHFLNNYWNKQKNLEKLLKVGDIFNLGTTIDSTISELSEFQKQFKNIESYFDKNGIVYYAKNRPETLEVVFHSTNTLEEICNDSIDYNWKYILFLNNQFFELTKENNLL